MELKDSIKALSEICGPAGFEDGAAKLAQEMLKPLVDRVYRDSIGNVIGVRHCGMENAKKLLIDTHIDEVGFVITGSENGFLKFDTLGRIDGRLLPASEILILGEEPFFGVIGTLPPHVLKREDMKRTTPIDDLFIDTGGREVPPGTPAVFASEFKVLSEGALCGKALDNRSGFAIALDTLQSLGDAPLHMDIYIMASVQEELGLRGARPGAFSIMPHQAIIIDVTFAHTPGTKRERTLDFGGGAAIGMGPHTSRGMTEHITRIARENEIPHQFEVMSGDSGTNAGPIQLTGEGVPTAIISLPLKYMHSPVETIKIDDAVAISNLLSLYLKNPWKGGWANA